MLSRTGAAVLSTGSGRAGIMFLFAVCSGDDRTGEGSGDDEVCMNTLLLLVVCTMPPSTEQGRFT